jgi:hypothetical protein
VPMALTRAETAYLRLQLGSRFGTAPSLDEGFLVRARKTGTAKGELVVPSGLQSLVDRGLAEIRQVDPRRPFKAFLTEAGFRALAEAVRDRRSFNPERYGHVVEELRAFGEHSDGP